jgi:hypothetical protein
MVRIFVAVLIMFFLSACSTKHMIKVSDISVRNSSKNSKINKERYLFFKPVNYDADSKYSKDMYCTDKNNIIKSNNYSTQIYIQIQNNQQDKITGLLPQWILVNDKSHSCNVNTSNFVSDIPLLVKSDNLPNLKVLLAHYEENKIPFNEMMSLMESVADVYTGSSLSYIKKANELLGNKKVQLSLDHIVKKFDDKGSDNTKSKEFNQSINQISINLEVNTIKDNEIVENKKFGHIILKPYYRDTLLKNIINDFETIDINDENIKNLTEYPLSKGVNIQSKIKSFKKLADNAVIDELHAFKVQIDNKLSSYDKSLVLYLAYKQTDLFKSINNNTDIETLRKKIDILKNDRNPLKYLDDLKKHSLYFTKYNDANTAIKTHDTISGRIRNIENFLYPVARDTYNSNMFVLEPIIKYTDSDQNISVQTLSGAFTRNSNVSGFGCYNDLQRRYNNTTVQEYLIPNIYAGDEIYNYMAISVDTSGQPSIIFYKMNNQRISKILIDKSFKRIQYGNLRDIVQAHGSDVCRKMFGGIVSR